MKSSLHIAFLLAALNALGVGACAKQHAECAEHDALARTCFTRNDAETFVPVHVEVVDEREVRNGEVREYGWLCLLGGRAGSEGGLCNLGFSHDVEKGGGSAAQQMLACGSFFQLSPISILRRVDA